MIPGMMFPRPQVGPGGMQPLAAPRPPGAFSRPMQGNFSPNNLGVGILSAPTATVVGAPKPLPAPGAPPTRRAVAGKVKKMMKPARTPNPTTGVGTPKAPGAKLAQVKGPTGSSLSNIQ